MSKLIKRFNGHCEVLICKKCLTQFQYNPRLKECPLCKDANKDYQSKTKE